MSISTADAKKRVVLPKARPGDVFDVRSQTEGQYLLVRLERPEPGAHRSRKDCLRAIAQSPLKMKMDWNQLKGLTREP